MKALLNQLAEYNVWANRRMTDTVCGLTEALQRREVPGSFPSLHATLVHMWNAESMWWQRMKMQEPVIGPGEAFTGSTPEACAALLQQNDAWVNWVRAATPAALDHVFHYQNTRREQFKQPVYQMLLHVFNHGTYHRGQLVNMLRQLQVTSIPPTDFIVWSRKK